MQQIYGQKQSNVRFKFSLLMLSMSAVSVTFAAEDQATNVGVITVVGTGQAASVDAALREQQASDSVSSVVHADGIGQLPDDNAAEALQRLPGVSVERDQGEGRFVTVRGLGADLNTVTINGTLVPAPESDRRGVALDVLPSELVQSLSVVKTLTPDMDANSLGATVQVNSLSAFDHKGLFTTGSIEGSYDAKREKYSPKVSGAISNRFSIGSGEDNFGVAAALSYQNRKFGSDNVESEWENSKLTSTEMRQYDIERERIGAGLNFDFRTDSGQYYLKTLYSRFKDTEARNALAVEFDDGLAIGETGTSTASRELKARTETQEIQSYVFGGKQQFGTWLAEGQIGYSVASEDNPNYYNMTYESNNEVSGLSYSSTRVPVISGGSDLYDASNYTLSKVKWTKESTKDTEKNAKLDLSRDYNLGAYFATFKFGGKISQREKTNDTDIYNATLSNTALVSAGADDFELANFGPLINKDAGLASVTGWSQSIADSTVGDYKSNENIRAIYAMNTIDIDKLRIIAGLRYEDTEFKTNGYQYDGSAVSATSAKNNYDHWLPGLHLRYKVNDATILRAAYTKTVVRPIFAQSSAGVLIDGDEAEFGNPDLKPLESNNLDVSAEYYFGKASVVSANLFYKDIKNFIYSTDLAGTGAWKDYDTATTYENGKKAKVYGVELAYSQKFEYLPAPWNGVLVGLNATFSHSDAEITGAKDGISLSRKIRLPSQSNAVGNAMLGWENERFGFRFSANYKSPYLLEVAGSIDEPQNDKYVDQQVFVDFSSHWNVTKNLQVKFDIANLNNEKYYVYSGRKAQNAQYEEYGPTFKLGLTWTNF
ncbi:MAG: TonB-dependent receptor [Acinetobacter sp.]